MKFIEEGGFSSVYLADDGLIYKIYHKDDNKSVKLFDNEIMIMERLRHKQIPELLWQDRENLCLVMTRCKGKGLDFILHYHVLSKKQKRIIAEQLVEVMMYVHSKGVLYLDLKPENVLVDMETMNICLVDFNISTLCGHKQKPRTGTLGYISPEVLNGHDYSYPADVYSFGVLLYVLYTQKPVETFGGFRFLMPPDIRRLISWCTRPDPASRPVFHDVADMIRKTGDDQCCCSVQ